MQMKLHMDSGDTRDCSSGSHLYVDDPRCYSRTPSIVLCVAKVHSLDLALALPAHHVQIAHAHSCVGS